MFLGLAVKNFPDCKGWSRKPWQRHVLQGESGGGLKEFDFAWEVFVENNSFVFLLFSLRVQVRTS